MLPQLKCNVVTRDFGCFYSILIQYAFEPPLVNVPLTFIIEKTTFDKITDTGKDPFDR